MAAIYLILLCSFLISYETFGLDYEEYGRNKNAILEKEEIENYWKKIKVIKRSVGNENGKNDTNLDLSTTTPANLSYNNYSPGTESNNTISVKQINSSANSGESQNVENSQISPQLGDSSIQGNFIDNLNYHNSQSNTNNQMNDIDSNYTSGNKTVNKNENSTAISQSAIPSSNQSSEHISEYALSISQNETRNNTVDNFATPSTSKRPSASNEIQSTTDDTANMLGGNNLNTSPPPTQLENKMNNEIPELSTQGPDVNSLIQTTSNVQNMITTQQATIPTQNGIITTIKSHANNSNTSPALAPEASDEPLKDSNPARNETVYNSSKTTIAVPENTTEPITSVGTNHVFKIAVTSEPGVSNQNTTNALTSEPLPVPEPENNATVVEPETTSEPVSSGNETINTNPGPTVQSVTNSSNPGLISSGSQSSTSYPNVETTTHNATGSNLTDMEGPDSTGEPIVITNGTVEPEPSAKPEFTDSPVTNSSTSEQSGNVEPTPEPEKTTTSSSTLRVTTTMQNTTTSKEDIDVSPQPEGEVTLEPEPENSTKSENFANKTTVTRSSSTLKPTTATTSVKVVPEPTNKPKTTTDPARSLDTSHISVTSANPEPSDNVTTGSATVEPEISSSTGKTQIYSSTDSKPEPSEEPSEGEPETEGENPESETDNELSDAEGKPEYRDNAFAEPGPEWKLAKEVWREAWEFHVYFFGIAFSLLGLYCVVTLIRLWNMEHLLSKHYFITLHLLVIAVCVLRATYLIVDAYNSLGTFPFGLDYFMYSTAFPCLTALFSILFYALLLATRVRVISVKVQKLWVLILIVLLHFILSIATDIVVGIFTSASIMIFICQAFFILWGLLMFVGYLVLFRKLYKGAMTHQKLATGSPVEHKHNTSHTYQVKPTKQKYTLGLAVKITFISAFFGVAIVGFELYGMFGVYGVLKFETKPDPWPWWTYHTIVRSLEILMCLGVAYVASQPLKYKMKKDINHKIYDYLLPCSLCCCPNKLDQNEIYSSSISLDYVVSETDHLSWLKKIKNKSPSPKAPYPPHTAEKYSDPDATLLVRKIKRTSKPSMLVVEDGFVRIRREDENLPSNQYELDSRSSHSSDMNVGPDGQNTGALTNVVNLNYTGHSSPIVGRENVPGVNFENYLLQGSVANQGYVNNDESADETDIDIVVTESEHESDSHDSPESAESGASNKSADIFRPLSMIDLAASMESELDRAFHSNYVDEADIISHNSLPPSLDKFNKNSSDCAFNENLCDKYCDNGAGGAASNLDSTNYSSDSADDQSKSSDARLMRPLVRRCKSDDSKSSSPKYKHFEKNKYFSVSSVDTIGKDEEFTTHFGSNGEMRTEL